MLEPFLKTFAKDLWKRYQPDLGDFCIVLPNRRGALFLKEYLSEEAGKNIFSPEIYSTEDLIYKLSGLRIIDNTELLFELYTVYSSTMQGTAESFEAFSKWAPTLIADFNEIDRYLIDARQLFINLGSIKEIENWSLNSADLSEFQLNYIHFWETLGQHYKNLRSRMESSGKAWQGLAYRYVAEHLDAVIAKLEWKKIFFVGFNALNAAEEKIFAALLQAGKAELSWDADAYYLNDPIQEAGKFLRKYKAGFFEDEKKFNWISNSLQTTPREIQIIGTARNIAQAKLAGTLLKDFQKENASLHSTALVLADENLLFPVLSSIPEGIDEINVTMGYPLRNTPMASLFSTLFQLHINAEKFSKGRKGEKRFYHQDLNALLRHPYIRQAFRDSELVPELSGYILKNNVIFMGAKQMEKICKEKFPDEWGLIRGLIAPWNTLEDSFSALNALIQLLRTTFQSKPGKKENSIYTSMETELLFQFNTFVNRLHTLCSQYGHITEFKTLHSLFSLLSNSSTIPFYGEPLRGLQVMGMLETRTLDFENIILLSANENILPSGKSQNSFIPFDLKKLFGMPLYTDRDAVFAYHFYRLLQRAKKVYLLYNTESDKFGDGEKSRYITQLVHELAKLNPAMSVKESLLALDFQDKTEEPVRIKKDQVVLEKLNRLSEKGFSPTLLNTFRNCSLRFYLHYVAGIREAEEVEEEIGADTLGNVIHDVLETLYTPYVGKLMTAEDIRQMLPGLEEHVKQAYANFYPEEVIASGKNLLSFRISLKFIRDFLLREEKLLTAGKELHIRELEKEMEVPLQTGTHRVLIKGKADRIDRLGKDLRIIDYKTGKAGDAELKVNNWEELLANPKLDKSFQLLSYAWLYSRTSLSQEELTSGIISFRKLSEGLKAVSTPDKSTRLKQEKLEEFEEVLKKLIDAIFDETQEFIQTEDPKNCEYCSFRVFCNR